MAYDPKDPDTIKAVKAAITEALAEAEEEHQSAIEGLKAKNSELLGKLKKAREGQGDPANVEKLENELETAKADLVKAQKDLKKVTGERDGFKTQAETEAAASKRLVVETGLTNELVAVGVRKEFMPAVKKLLAEKVEQTIDGENRSATVGGKPLSEFVKTWSQSDEGKIYVTAPANGGGNAPGGQASGANGAKTMPRSQWNALDQNGRAAFAKEGGQVVEA